MKIKTRIRTFLFRLCTIITFFPGFAYAQKKGKKQPPNKPITAKDSVKTTLPIIAKVAPDAMKPYKEVIPGSAISSNGYFKVHQVADKYYLEIPDSLLGRQLLTVNRISRSAADFRKPEASSVSYAGDEIGGSLFNFSKGPAGKLFASVTTYKDRSTDSSENGLSRALYRSTLDPVIAAFAIKAINEQEKSTVIDISDYLNTDNLLFGFSNTKKQLAGLTMPLADRSYIQSVKAFPKNIEIKTVKTFQKQDGGLSPMMTFTFELNSSMILLPKVPMKGRIYDERVGYQFASFTNFDSNPRGVKETANILRWRMTPQAADMEKYHRGELVEPENPLIIYIDPAMPKKWVPYLIQGINDWQVAFEQAGFKNAISGKEAPTNDPQWSIDDARHNVIVFKPAEQTSSNGDVVHDPRSGEILEAHISWYHNTLNNLYKNYLLQAGAVDLEAQNPQFSDELMGKLVRAEISRIIGSKLGLRANLQGSAGIPVDSLRNKKFLSKNGLSLSITDTNPYNYVAQPEDQLNTNQLIPKIGAYDKWAIEWGYRILPGNQTENQETEILSELIKNKLARFPAFNFGQEALVISDPRNQKGDLGDNPLKASAYGIANLKRIAPNVLTWTRMPNEDYERAKNLYIGLIDQYEKYLKHVALQIGGVYTTVKKSDQQGAVFGFVRADRQRKAMDFLQKELFDTPLWLNNITLYKLSYTNFDLVQTVQKNILGNLLDVRCISKLVSAENNVASGAYTARAMLAGLSEGIFSELPTRKTISLVRRELQKAYVLKLSTLLQSGAGADSEVGTVLRSHAKNLLAKLKTASPNAVGLAKPHLSDLYNRLFLALYNPSALPAPAAAKRGI